MKRSAIIGKIITVVAFILSMSLSLLMLTIPLFIVSVILIWMSNENISLKRKWTIYPLISWWPGYILIATISDKIDHFTAQKVDFIIPEGFTGRIMVIENIKCGQPKKVINSREEIIVPDNGIVLYQGELKRGSVNNYEYYSLHKNGKKNKINGLDKADSQAKGSDYKSVSVMASGEATINTVTSGIKYKYIYLLVSAQNITNNQYVDDYKYTRTLNEMADSLVLNCR